MASRRATTPNRYPRSSSANTERIANYCDDYVPIGIASAMAHNEPSGTGHSNHDSRSVGTLSQQSSLSSIPVLASNAAADQCTSGSGDATSLRSQGGVMAQSHVSFSEDQSSRPPPPRHVTVLQPDQNKPKPTGSRRQTANAFDIAKAIQKCREDAVKRFDVSKSQLTQIPATIKDLTSLVELYLYQNKLILLPPEIGYLTELQTLGVSENSLTGLPDSLVNLRKLRVLDLRHNKLNDIPPVVYQLTNLNTLFLRFNRIRLVDNEIGHLNALTTLSLRENKIDTLPPAIGRLVNLVGLDVSYNHLKTIPYDIGNCAQLQSLDLQHNEIRTLPASIGNLKLLNRLGLRYNQLESLPRTLSNCSQIQEFNIESNNVNLLPDGLLSSLVNLSSITLSRNKFDSFPMGGPMQFRSVTSLSMELNQVKNIPYGIFSRAECLSKLNMSINQLTSLPLDIRTWNKIVELNLGTNQVRYHMTYNCLQLPSDFNI